MLCSFSTALLSLLSSLASLFVMILLLCILLHSVSSLNIRIDGDNGIDFKKCLTEQPQSSCQSLKYVADNINNTGNLTIEIISPTLSLQGSVIFTDINGLTINGQGTSISCRNGSIPYGNSGIVFDKCSNVKLNSFTIEHCGLLYKNEEKHPKRQSVLFYNCRNFNISKVNFSDNNGYGLVLYDSIHGIVMKNVFANNGIKLSEAETSNAGGGLCILQYTPHNRSRSRSTNFIAIASNQFINNFATHIGGALYMEVDHCANLLMFITTSNFIGNRAGTAGGAIGFIVHKSKCNYNGTIPFGFHISLLSCNITNNVANCGGGVAIQIVHYEALLNVDNKKKEITFNLCNFTGNKGMISSAVDINGKSQKVNQCLETYVNFLFCYFTENIAGIDNNQQELKGKLFKATLYATDAIVFLVSKISFANNTGTALYAVNTRVYVTRHAHINFYNNTGDQGGAIFFADGSTIDYNEHTPNASSFINISNNKALIGGAIYIQSLINIHEGTCFISNHHNVTFHFTNNNATSGFGRDIFVSTLKDCVTLYSENATTLFKAGKMGKFKFTSWTPPPVATAPVKLSLNEKELVPYPGIPYNMTITQMDELNSTITNLQLFPLSATLLQNVHNNSSLKIDITYSIANNYIIVFKGTVGDTATLLLQTTEYSAREPINITLYHCPPGYIFQINTCQCNSNYYYGILHCLEDDAAIIDGGLWAGYIGETFATADCVTSLCDYHNSKGSRHEDHVLPLNYSLLNDHVCASHRNGVLCGSCITDYTTYLHSPSYHCGESTHCQYGPLLYIVSEIIPVTGIFLVILFFNINLTSGALYSFIFYSQVVNNHYRNTVYSGPLVYFFQAFKMIYGIFDLETFEIDQLSFCLFKDATIMDLMLIKYLTTLYALLLIIITILVLKFHSFHCCIKLCHKCGRRNIRGSIVNALTAFLVLCYFHCLIITLYILFPSYVKGDHEVTLKTVPLYNGEMSYLSTDHLKYVTPALICLMVIILPPPIILLSEPLLVRVSGVLNIRRNAVTYTLHRLRMKLKPFLDSFQGCFKDNCRCFAGLFFLYRILLVLIPIYFSDGKFWNIMTKELLMFCILFLHCLCAPFQEKLHNHIKSFLLLDLLLINTLQLAPLNSDNNTTTLVAVFQVVLMSLPLVYLLCYIGQYTCCTKHCIENKFNSITSPSGHNNNDDDDDDDELPQRLLPEFNESYDTFNKSD